MTLLTTRTVGLLVIAVLATACVASPVGEYASADVRTESRLSGDDTSVRRDSQERMISRATLRIRARTCFGVATGSGFAITDELLVTNRHVVEGADALQVSTWDGQSLDVAVSGIALTDDLALALVRGSLPVTLELHEPPSRGDAVVAVGYPGGRELRFTHGRVLGEMPIDLFGRAAPAIRMSNEIRPGNSGGPLLDDAGRVVGVVFAIDRQSGNGLAVPIDALEHTVRRAGFFDNPSPC